MEPVDEKAWQGETGMTVKKLHHDGRRDARLASSERDMRVVGTAFRDLTDPAERGGDSRMQFRQFPGLPYASPENC